MRPVRTVMAVLCAGLLGACGSGAAASSNTATVSAAPTPTAPLGTSFSSAAFTTVVPTGWTSRLSDPAEVQKFTGSGEVEYLVEQQPPGLEQQNVNDVIGNINVVLLSTPVPDDQVQQYLSSVSDSGASNLSTPKSFTIDGATGQYITYDRDISGTPGESQDMVINHAGNTYDIVIITSQFAYDQQHPALEAVLTAWHWRG